LGLRRCSPVSDKDADRDSGSSRRRAPLLAVLALTTLGLGACGRLGFDPTTGAAPDVVDASAAQDADGVDAATAPDIAAAPSADAATRDAVAATTADAAAPDTAPATPADAASPDTGPSQAPADAAAPDTGASQDPADAAAPDTGASQAPADAAAPDTGASQAPALTCAQAMTWETSFSTDPTASAEAGQWAMRKGAVFDPGELAAGVWRTSSGVALDSHPDVNFVNPFEAAVRVRVVSAPTAGNQGALLWINAGFTPTELLAVFVSVQRVAESAQRVSLFNTRHHMPALLLAPPIDVPHLDFVDVRLRVDARTGDVTLWVEGVLRAQATAARVPRGPNNDMFASLLASGATAEFDHARLVYCAEP
jgi:hypothetical protein